MRHRPFNTLLAFIRGNFHKDDPAESTDAALLERFAKQRDEAAFTVLVERHGPLVVSVCRRVLGNFDDAEDAFQATFLILARKADSIRKPGSLASWLYGVAYRVALEARRRTAERRGHERSAEQQPAQSADEAVTREVCRIVDDEVAQLPPKYRAPVVLHYFAGSTKEETARQLGWTEGTVSGRLARARDLLRTRLTRRGVALSAAALTTALFPNAVACVSASLANSTIKLASLFAVGQVGGGASGIVGLTETVLKTMALGKGKLTVAACAVLLALGLGAGGMFLHAQADPTHENRKLPEPGAAPKAVAKEIVQAKKEANQPLLRVPIPDRTMLTVAISPHGKRLAVAPQDKTIIQLWDVATGKQHTLQGHAFSVVSLAFSPDEKILASATGSWLPDGAPGEIKLWDATTGKERSNLGRFPNMIIALAFSADGKRFASAGSSVKIWDVETGKELLEVKPAGGYTWSLAFSPDGATLATGVGVREDNTPGFVCLWDTATGKERAVLEGHVGMVNCVAFTPDGKMVASADSKGTVKVWNVAIANERLAVPNPAHSFFLQSLAVSSDSKYLLGTLLSEPALVLKKWDLATGKEQAAYQGGSAERFVMALSGDGNIVGVGGPGEAGQGKLELWQLGSLLAPKGRKEPDQATPPMVKPQQENVGSREIADPADFAKAVAGSWRENRIRAGMKAPQLLEFSAKGRFAHFKADAKGGHWITGRYQVRSANRIWLDELTENLDQENRRSIMQLVLTRGAKARRFVEQG